MENSKEMILGICMTAFAVTVGCAIALKKKRVRRWSVRPINRNRNKEGVLATLLKNMEHMETDHQQFFVYTRMTPNLFNVLLSKIGPSITKNSCGGSLSPRHRLFMTIHYLAEGCSMQEVAWNYRVGKSTSSVIIKETCEALWNILAPEYLPQPTEDKWIEISNEYYRRWNMPNCVGAVDGKHIVIQAPAHSGSEFLNYKKTFSLVLMAVCDSYYRFTLVDIGAAGGNHDSTVFKNSCFGQMLLSNSLFISQERTLPKSNVKMPCFIVADAAFPLHKNIMRPYPGTQLSDKKNIFNYRLSRARRCIENTFGIMVSRWRILKRPLTTQLETSEAIVQAVVVLHNFLQSSEEDLSLLEKKYCPTGFADYVDQEGRLQEGLWRGENAELRALGRVRGNNPSRLALKIRDTLADYFVSQQGMVPWQEDHIYRGAAPML